jgi:hypothetical protein
MITKPQLSGKPGQAPFVALVVERFNVRVRDGGARRDAHERRIIDLRVVPDGGARQSDGFVVLGMGSLHDEAQ